MTFYGEPIKNLENLPSIPTALNKLLEAIDDSSVSNKEVAQIIGFDPILTAKVLSIANSALFGGRSRISDVSFAVTRLGRGEIKNIAMTIYIANMVSDLKLNLIKLEEFWKHSLATAFIARKLISHIIDTENAALYSLKNDIYIAGLLHDLGYVVLDMYSPQDFEQILSESIRDEYPIIYIEQNSYSNNHAFEGANILKYWSLPDSIVGYVRNHHYPEDAGNESNLGAAILNMADYIANLIGFSSFVAGNVAPYSEAVWQLFDFKDNSEEEIKTLFNEFLGQSKLFIAFSEMVMNS
jgi:HD-like signal output (HDOD) protein